MSVKTTEHYLRQMIEHSSIPCVATDPNLPDNPIIAANAAFAQLVGYSPAEILGRNCRFLTGPQTEPAARDRLREAVARALPVVVEITNHARDGTAFRNAVTIAPLFDSAGRVEFFVGSQIRVGEGGLSARRISSGDRIATLSHRQKEVLSLMAHGMRHAEIAERLKIVEKTVKMHRAALVKKLGCRTSVEAIRMGIEGGL